MRKLSSVRSTDPLKIDLLPASNKKDLIGSLRDPDIERFIDVSRPLWEEDARLVRVPGRTLETQVRLHLPALSRETILKDAPKDVYERVRVQALVRSAEIGMSSVDAAYEAHFSMLVGGSTLRRDLAFVGDNGYHLQLNCGVVTPSTGQFVQSRLHYLRSARSDTSFEFGLFTPGATMPIAYAAFSPVDRRYLIEALHALGLEAEPRELVVLTRMHGLPNIPRNTMSLMLGRTFKHIREHRIAKYVITAFNPMLGFEGTTFHATGFAPFALSPVVYNYDDNHFFSTRRLRRGPFEQRLDVPCNMLLVAGVTREAKKSLTKRLWEICRIPVASHSEEGVQLKRFSSYDKECIERLTEYRAKIQAAWSEQTVHPKYRTEYDDPTDPRGQCGVASVWLARALRHEFGVESMYCYGRLNATKPRISSVEHHCWVEIGDESDPFRTVIDLTSDQVMGVAGPVLCGRHADLIADGLSYDSVSRLRLDELPKDRVWRRFMVLSDGANHINM